MHLERPSGTARRSDRRSFNCSSGASGIRYSTAPRSGPSGFNRLLGASRICSPIRYPLATSPCFNRSLGASGTAAQTGATCGSVSDFNRPSGASGTRDGSSRVDSDDISTVCRVHLKLDSLERDTNVEVFQPFTGCIWNELDYQLPTDYPVFQPFTGCIWNTSVVSMEPRSVSFQPFVGCIWNCTGPARSASSTARFNRPLGASGTCRHGQDRRSLRSFNRSLGASGTSLQCCHVLGVLRVSTVHWVHLERDADTPGRSASSRFNRPLSASGTPTSRTR